MLKLAGWLSFAPIGWECGGRGGFSKGGGLFSSDRTSGPSSSLVMTFQDLTGHVLTAMATLQICSIRRRRRKLEIGNWKLHLLPITCQLQGSGTELAFTAIEGSSAHAQPWLPPDCNFKACKIHPRATFVPAYRFRRIQCPHELRVTSHDDRPPSSSSNTRRLSCRQQVYSSSSQHRFATSADSDPSDISEPTLISALRFLRTLSST